MTVTMYVHVGHRYHYIWMRVEQTYHISDDIIMLPFTLHVRFTECSSAIASISLLRGNGPPVSYQEIREGDRWGATIGRSSPQ